MHKLFKYILMVPGNHEYYTARGVKATESTLRNICEATNTVLLQRGSWVHPNYKIVFYGCTLWSKITVDAMHKLKDIGRIYHDHHQIMKMHKDDVDWLTERILKAPADHKVVVVTHHAPSSQCIDEIYKQQTTDNSAYFTDLEHLLQPPVVAWVCGHTHAVRQFVTNGVQVILNPIGYKREKINNNYSGPFTI